MRAWSWGALILAVGCGGDVEYGGDDADASSGGSTVDTSPLVDTGFDADVVTTLPTGGAETCLWVNGGSDRVRAPAVGTPIGQSPQTIEAWVRTASLAPQVAVSHGLASPGKAFYLGTHDGYLMMSTAGLEHVEERFFVADGEWHHVAITYNGREATLTMDGERGEAVAFEDVDIAEGEVVAGAAPTTGGYPWVGWIDDVRIYQRERTASDLRSPEVEDDRGLVMWWDFEVEGKGAGVTVPDQSGLGADGTSGGAEGTPEFRPCR